MAKNDAVSVPHTTGSSAQNPISSQDIIRILTSSGKHDLSVLMEFMATQVPES